MTSPRISVVLPVYNEHLNIEACLRGLWKALADVEHEILVCYDFDADSTLPAIAAMGDRPPTVRLVKNDIGRGAANALRAGFAAATGDVVVTTMADLSDPPELIPAMAAKMRGENAAVVSGSRYVKGGSQTGGPLFKRICSQTASLTLKWISGLSTHDATSNFRAYSREFLDTVRIESKQGFEIALELTVKAHLAGLRVAEVPSTWTDRTAGESRFRLWKWAPNYLRWYWEAMAAPVFVWIVLIATLAGTHFYVAHYAENVPVRDDLEMSLILDERIHIPLRWWWLQFNEHRIPLPKLITVPLILATHDVRSGMYFSVYLLGAVSLAMILAARRLRGRASYTDAFFPLLLLTWGNAENLLMMHQVSLMLPTAITCTLLLMFAGSPVPPKWKKSLAIGLCLFALPLCGGPGITPAPAIAMWLLYAGWTQLRSREPGSRASGWILLGSVAATAALIGFYFVGFVNYSSHSYNDDYVEALRQSVMFLSLGFGTPAEKLWPLSGWAVGALALSAVVTLFVAFRARPAERLRILGLVAICAGIFSMALSSGIARSAGNPSACFALRYVTLPAPFFCSIYLAFCLYGPTAVGRFVRVSLASILLALVALNVEVGVRYGSRLQTNARRVLDDIARGMTTREIAIAHWEQFYGNPLAFRARLEFLRAAGFGPFAKIRVEPGEPQYSMLLEPPMLISSARAGPRKVDGVDVFLVPPECELHFNLDAGKRAITGRFGIYPLAYEFAPEDGVKFTVELHQLGYRHRALFERVLNPKLREEERGFQSFEIELEPGAQGALVLRTSFAGAVTDDRAFGYWTDFIIK